MSAGKPADRLRLFLAGDVMLGRGIDQVLPHPGDPKLYESYVGSAVDYVRLAERASGAIARPVTFDYVWGDLLEDLEARQVDLRIVNLETAVTKADVPWPKGINYRMHPANLPVLSAAGIDACILANNHVMDWGAEGLVETVEALEAAGIGFAGAGRSAAEAARPLELEAGGARVVLLAFGDGSSGVPVDWAARGASPGVNMLPSGVEACVDAVQRQVAPVRRPGDAVIVSVHWGANWGEEIPARQREIAHRLIDGAGVQVVFGHSSHHPKRIERHGAGLVFYGAGDLINDYEGIGGHEWYHPETGMACLVDLDRATGAVLGYETPAYTRRKFRLEKASATEAAWVRKITRGG